MLTIMLFLPLTGTSIVANPTKLTTMTSLAPALMLNSPAEFVNVAFDVPFTAIVAPATGLLSPSITVPLTVCAYTLTVIRKKDKKRKQERENPGENASNIIFFIIASCFVNKGA